MTYTLNGINLQQIQRERHRRNADLDKTKFPASDTEEVLLYDYSGVDRVIRIEGIAYFTTKQTLMDSFVTPIEELLSGSQSTIIYHSDLVDNATSGDYQDGNFNVMVNSFEWVYVEGEVLKVNYTLELWEGQG